MPALTVVEITYVSRLIQPSGLKYQILYVFDCANSLGLAAEWIEIFYSIAVFFPQYVSVLRSRGLKYRILMYIISSLLAEAYTASWIESPGHFGEVRAFLVEAYTAYEIK